MKARYGDQGETDSVECHHKRHARDRAAQEAGEAEGEISSMEDVGEPVGDYGRYSDDGYDTHVDGDGEDDEEEDSSSEEKQDSDDEAEPESSSKKAVEVVVDTGSYSDDGYDS